MDRLAAKCILERDDIVHVERDDAVGADRFEELGYIAGRHWIARLRLSILARIGR